MKAQRIPQNYTAEDLRMMEMIRNLPQPYFNVLKHLMHYTKTFMLKEIFLPETELDRLYELALVWMDAELYETYYLTALRIIDKSGAFDCDKFQEAARKRREAEQEKQGLP